jgi:hypothetical protein
LCTEPLLFAVTIRVPKLYGGTVSLGRCRFVPPGRFLGARAGGEPPRKCGKIPGLQAPQLPIGEG